MFVAPSHGSNPQPPCLRISSWRASSSGRELACIGPTHITAVARPRRGGQAQPGKTLPLTGDLQYDADPTTFELNGIVAAGHKRLIAVQSRLGKLFVINARNGRTHEIDLGGATTPNGDGLLLHGRTLYVVQNRDNKIAVIHLEHGLRRGEIKRYLTDDDFDVPTTIAERGGFLWAVNARFTTPPTPTTPYDVVRVSR